MDLEPFQRINPCGYAGMQMVRLADLVEEPCLPAVAQRLIAHLAGRLGRNTAAAMPGELPEHCLAQGLSYRVSA